MTKMGALLRVRTLVISFLLLMIIVPKTGTASEKSLNYEISPSKVVLKLSYPEGLESSEPAYKVRHTTNPMKVIIDLSYSLPNVPAVISTKDVALSAIRTSRIDGGATTRIVLDFNYELPAPKAYLQDGQLIVEVDKIFMRENLRSISYGVKYGHQRRAIAAGPLIINYLWIDIVDPEIEVKMVLAQDRVTGSERVSNMAKRSNALAAVNGAFFASDGRPLGLLAINGEFISESYANRTALGLGKNFAIIDSVTLNGTVRVSNGESIAISGLNRPRLQDELIIYTPAYGSSTRTNIYGIEIVLIDGVVTQIEQGGSAIPENGIVLSGHGKARDLLMQLQVGDQVQLDFELVPDWFSLGVTEIIGGGPRLVKDGKVHITGVEERFQNDILNSRAPRTALGIRADGSLLLVTVNGRNPGISVGMTLEELAELMIELGAVDAMNLDGGGSTTMVIRDMVLNIPSDGIERSVSNAIIVTTPETRR